LDAAEELFATAGIDGAAVSAIIARAGARNKAAVAYHFGSKFDLLEAVISRHLVRLDAHRAVLLDAIERNGAPTVRDLVDALIAPVAAQLQSPSGVRYLQIQAALLGHPNRVSLPAAISDPRQRFARLERMMRELTTPGPHAQANWMLISSLIFHGLADFARSPRTTARQRDEFVAALTDAVVAILTQEPRRSQPPPSRSCTT
jgi:AcrR family transcriptional regulator